MIVQSDARQRSVGTGFIHGKLLYPPLAYAEVSANYVTLYPDTAKAVGFERFTTGSRTNASGMSTQVLIDLMPVGMSSIGLANRRGGQRHDSVASPADAEIRLQDIARIQLRHGYRLRRQT